LKETLRYQPYDQDKYNKRFVVKSDYKRICAYSTNALIIAFCIKTDYKRFRWILQ